MPIIQLTDKVIEAFDGQTILTKYQINNAVKLLLFIA